MNKETKNEKKVRIAAIADIHVGETSHGNYQQLFKDISQQADVVVVGGDLTNHGLPEEAKVLAEELKACTIPFLSVLGNHDYESGKHQEIRKVLLDAGVTILEDEVYEIHNVGFTGVKGFGGGYGQYMLGYFGEPETKAFVQAALDEVKKLEVGLGKLAHMSKKVVVMHYAPIVDTNKGEPIEIYPFLGTSRFEEVIDRFNVTVAFHGHSHYGTHEGKTMKNIPVYNVSMNIMEKINKQKPYKVITL